jgi:hypothetical protein
MEVISTISSIGFIGFFVFMLSMGVALLRRRAKTADSGTDGITTGGVIAK